jgi:hypothetical protein
MEGKKFRDKKGKKEGMKGKGRDEKEEMMEGIKGKEWKDGIE